jgi:hypothetical protein
MRPTASWGFRQNLIDGSDHGEEITPGASDST